MDAATNKKIEDVVLTAFALAKWAGASEANRLAMISPGGEDEMLNLEADVVRLAKVRDDSSLEERLGDAQLTLIMIRKLGKAPDSLFV